MSVILDALKKAQNERKDVTRNLPYNPKKKTQTSRWYIYIVASLVFCVLIVFLLIPTPEKLARPPIAEVKVAQTPPPASPPVPAEKAPEVMQPPVPVTSHTTQQSDSQKAAIKYVKPVKEQKKIAASLSRHKPGMKELQATEPLQHITPQNGSKALATVDHEKINIKFNEAVKETEKGNISGTKRLYQSILAEHPSHIEALNNLGVIAMKEGNTKEALFYFNKVLKYKKDYGKAYNNIGLLMMKDGQKNLAEEYFRKSIELGGGVDPSLNLAALLRTEKRFEEAGRLLEAFINNNIKNRSLNLSYALIKDDMGQYEEAIQYYRLYLREAGSTGERSEVVERLKILENAQSLINR